MQEGRKNASTIVNVPSSARLCRRLSDPDRSGRPGRRTLAERRVARVSRQAEQSDGRQASAAPIRGQPGDSLYEGPDRVVNLTPEDFYHLLTPIVLKRPGGDSVSPPFSGVCVVWRRPSGLGNTADTEEVAAA